MRLPAIATVRRLFTILVLGAAALGGCQCGNDKPPAATAPAAATVAVRRVTATPAVPASATPSAAALGSATAPAETETPDGTETPAGSVTPSVATTPTAPPATATRPALATQTIEQAPAASLPLAGAPEAEPTEELPSMCDERSGGALVTFEICGERLVVWSVIGSFIDEASAQLEGGERRIPAFGALVDGPDCDPRWSWHLASGAMEFADATIEICNGCPSQVESDKRRWFEEIQQFCPWSAQVIDVDDRRGF